MNSKKKRVPVVLYHSKKVSLIAYKEIKSARNTPEKSKSHWGRFFVIILSRN
jgi:hypothetical protein